MTAAARFVAVEVDPGPGCPDGLSMRWKCAGHAQVVTSLRYESELGTKGVWSVRAVGSDDGVRAVQVDDSSEGIVWLVVGGRGGVELTHAASGEVERVPYLLLARVETG